jgi:hypothetical protein
MAEDATPDDVLPGSLPDAYRDRGRSVVRTAAHQLAAADAAVIGGNWGQL